MTVWIEGAKGACDFKASPYTGFAAGVHLTEFFVQGTVSCSLKGKSEIIYVRFNKLGVITDLQGNKLSTQLLHGEALRYVYVSDSEAAVVAGTGSAFTASSLVTLGLVVGVNMLQSAAVGSFWVFVNMLQMLSYVPAINCDFPYNLETFLTKYLTVSKISIPYDIFPDWVPNPMSYLSSFVTLPFSARFEVCGYETFSFIYNFSDQLTTWLLIFAFYVLLRILTHIIPESKYCPRHN